jgi:hypothetical protein|tara:strand:+ start:641 stop:1888 length:1248 start_codon:yes stop_codon:yes gene_type:complete
MSYNKCIATLGTTLKERGFENHKEIAAGMCKMWADENGVERVFGRTISNEPKRRRFALTIEEGISIELSGDEDSPVIQFPVIAITSGPHEYMEDDIQQKVYIEPTILKNNIESFKELPIYMNHQRTPEDLIGMANEPELFEMENGKTAIKMLATVSGSTQRGNEVLEKVKEGDITHVSIDWLSNDVDVMGDTFAMNVNPTEVSFIDNEKMDPVCKECTIGEKCDSYTEEKPHDCGCGGEDGVCECTDGTTKEVEHMDEDKGNSDAEKIVEREFASLRTQLEEATASKKEIETQYKEALKQIEAFKTAEEERSVKEAEARKVEVINTIISKEVLMGTLKEDASEKRVEELSAWEEMKLTGFSEALAAVPEPAEVERTFGKGKASESEEPMQEQERKFAVKWDNGRIKLDRSVLRGD